MKVVFKIIKAGSGNDIYFQRLAEALKLVNIDSEIVYYPKLFQYFPFLLKFFDKKIKGDITHSNVEYGWVFKEKNKPLLVTLLHSVFDKEYLRDVSFFQKLYYKFILKPNIVKSLEVADKRIAISEYTKKSFLRDFGKHNIDVIYPSLDTNVFKPMTVKSDDKRFKLLFVGNLTRRKGVDLLPKIMAELGDDYVLYYTSGLRSKPPEGFTRKNMIPLGKLTERQLVEEYNKCDALLFPTRLEGFGYCVAEAMSCGKPAIVSNTSSLPELIEDNKNGRLSTPNYVKDFAIQIYNVNKMLGDVKLKSRNHRKVNQLCSYHKVSKDYAVVLKNIFS